MKFVSTYLTRHHIRHTPHWWFFALCLSPFHVGELWYMRRYHLKFAHAKKLFLFDIGLLLSIILLAAGSIYWWQYDPTVRDFVDLRITASSDKIQSGDMVTYTISYTNNSEITLTIRDLTLVPPDGFIVIEPSVSHTSISILPKETKYITLSGYFYGAPDQDTRLTATISYYQQGSSLLELKRAIYIATARGSVLDITIPFPSAVLPNTTVSTSIMFTNTGDRPLSDIRLVLPHTDQYHSRSIHEEASLHIPILSPHTSVTLPIQTEIFAPTSTEGHQITMQFTPSILISQQQIPQETITIETHIISPHIAIAGTWPTGQQTIPETEVPLSLRLTHTGDVAIHDVVISLPLPPSIISSSRAIAYNDGTVFSDGLLLIDAQYHPELALIQPGQTLDIPITIPIVKTLSIGNDVSLVLAPFLSGRVPELPQHSYTQPAAQLPPLHIGTAITPQAELRYYTKEGDQLGRGPLPPRVGKETTYWMLLTLQNGTSAVSDVHVTIPLAPGVRVTGKQSVSHGNSPVYNPSQHTISWRIPSIDAHSQVGVYIEVGITPTTQQQGTTPVLIQPITITGHDTYIDKPITINTLPLTIGIPFDVIGRTFGSKIQ